MKNTNSTPWLLPDGIEQILAPEARSIEALRRDLLDLYRSWGYQLVMTPMVENLDSLLTGTAHCLELQTFTVVDQISGKQMGIRSDMTPQVARMDAHLLSNNAEINRLSYCGHLLHTRPSGISSTRAPLQIGAEIFGSEQLKSDIEVISLMIETLNAAGIKEISVDLGHVGIFSELTKAFNLSEQSEKALFDKLQRKSIPEIAEFVALLELNESQKQQLQKLAMLNGDINILVQARELFSKELVAIHQHLDVIEQVASYIEDNYKDVSVHCDLAELRGYEYHTGLVFSAFVTSEGTEIARGGRYDNVGKMFGEARPATGFSADIIVLQRLSNIENKTPLGILAPDTADPSCNELIKSLRQSGEIVIIDLSHGKQSAEQQNCNRIIKKQGSQWLVEE
ncbi:MAG: ATP phosphoribosyltransferase regulatory subunit [Gammaproteobacteria bacterium]|nr:ATP phosphoribosyltransferase regulatory subunit [Gammaproteobacteria bacterium]